MCASIIGYVSNFASVTLESQGGLESWQSYENLLYDCHFLWV